MKIDERFIIRFWATVPKSNWNYLEYETSVSDFLVTKNIQFFWYSCLSSYKSRWFLFYLAYCQRKMIKSSLRNIFICFLEEDISILKVNGHFFELEQKRREYIIFFIYMTSTLLSWRMKGSLNWLIYE